ncbi:unnamed protein product [Lactuca virosa]|uniref:Uncharacterized protein n=1 Tax=Lactuca virosa TaxID=75947 RepID=A0AAU9MYD9_9ASTR|nr:unnamed protein product [Lactuca virosa]
MVLEEPAAPIPLLHGDPYYLEYRTRYNPIPLDDGAPVPTEAMNRKIIPLKKKSWRKRLSHLKRPNHQKRWINLKCLNLLRRGFYASSSSFVRQIEYRNRGSDEQTEQREGSNLRRWLVARSTEEVVIDSNGGERRLRLLLVAFSLLILAGRTREEGCGFLRRRIIAAISLRRVLVFLLFWPDRQSRCFPIAFAVPINNRRRMFGFELL